MRLHDSRPSRPALHLLRASAAALLLAAAASGDARELAGPPTFDARALCAALPEELLFDEPGDGVLWVRGAEYKARFDARGATVVPYFGARAPRNFPLSFELASASLDGTPLSGLTAGRVTRDGAVVRIDRGILIEEYELGSRSLEQRFVFPALPKDGELRVRLAVATELAGRPLGEGHRFENELGHVDYGRAFALDAAGRRVEMESVLAGDTLELRVPASFVRDAAFPLTIDPLITFSAVAEEAHDELAPDVAYDASSDLWCVTWAAPWSATDSDAYARRIGGDGTLLDTVPIDLSTDLWVTPRVANNNASDLFLVCAAVVPASGLADVRGRFVAAATGAVGEVIPISPNDGAYRNFPDVGGDSFTVSPSNFCVVWQRFVTVDETDVECRVVSPAGELGIVRKLDTLSGHCLFPSISNSTGLSMNDGKEAWVIAWQREHGPWSHVWAAQVYWDGSIRQTNFPVHTGQNPGRNPSAATMLDSEGFGSSRTFLIAYELDLHDRVEVYAAIAEERTVLRTYELTTFPENNHVDQLAPSADSDGLRFLVAFEERETVDGSTGDVSVSSYYWLDAELRACERYAPLGHSAESEAGVAVHSKAATGGVRDRFFGAWERATAAGSDVVGGTWDGCSGIPPISSCWGNGWYHPCPCANEGGPGRGCGSSAEAQGALLAWSGDASVAEDDFSLVVAGSVPNQPGLFFQGDERVNGGSGLPFGDGLRCAGGNVARLELRVADASGAAASTPGIAASLGLQAGDQRRYQWWYRDPVGSPCGGGFNLTNLLEVIWAP